MTYKPLMVSKKYFTLFACCIPVKGANRSVICDLQRQEFFFINNEVYDLLMKFENAPFEKIFKSIAEEEKKPVKDLITYFIEQEIGFFCEDVSSFPKISMQYESPLVITNCIIDFDKDSMHDLTLISKQLSLLGCQDLQLRFQIQTPISEIDTMLLQLNIDRIQSIELLLPYYSDIILDLKQLLKQHVIISNIIIFDAPENGVIYEKQTLISLSTKKLDLCKSCGAISKKYFTLQLEAFQEAMHHNSCLNQKISIDARGEIKNCPSMKKSFGNIQNKKLEDVIFNLDFVKIWDINKDQISICTDCEFRYVCSDCRVFLESPDDIFSKPLKCGYNPYNNTWEDWSLNPLKERAIKFYEL